MVKKLDLLSPKGLVQGGMYTPTGTECNNVIYETDEEEFEIVCNTEGGGGGVHAPTGTKCNIVLVTPTVDYETDEEEFTRPRSRMQSFNQISAQAQTPSMRASKCKNTAKQRLQPGYHLNYLSMWWLRMEREGKREEEERKKREEEAKRGVRMKKWLERSMSDKKGLGPPGPGEGGVSNPVDDKFEECPDVNSLLRGGECFTRERGRGVEGEW